MPRTVTVAGLTLGLLLTLALPSIAAANAPASDADPATEARAALADPDLPADHRLTLELFVQINEQRAERGLHPLILDERLSHAAHEHSIDMARHRYCRHGGTDGSSARARMARHGYPYNNWAGENILCGRETAEAALGWWLSSGPHYRNLMHPHFTHIGIGVDMNGPWGPNWTLNFAAGADTTIHPELLGGDPALPAVAPDAPEPTAG